MNLDFDSDAITCPYCGHTEYPDVGFSVSHQCAGTRQAAIEQERKRVEFEQEQILRNKKILQQAKFLASSGLITLPEAIENIQVGGFLEEEEDE